MYGAGVGVGSGRGSVALPGFAIEGEVGHNYQFESRIALLHCRRRRGQDNNGCDAKRRRRGAAARRLERLSFVVGERPRFVT